MSIPSPEFHVDDAEEVREILASELSSEHTPSFDLSLTFPTISNPNSSNPSRSSTYSLGHIPTIKFAPLPSPDPNRKRSILPLGVAARSRRRRPARAVSERGPSVWANDPAADPLLEDPLITLGKLVKSATTSLWRRVREKNGLVNQVEPMQHLTDVILDIRPMEDQEHLMEMTPEHGKAVVAPEKQVVAPVEQLNTKWQWRRSTGTMPSVPGLH
ncbi:uncharacterized protein EDB91DRAFT_851104 [Suillus paluster]|uniref:uncharacterized protein n=1 Tax=Suillus paluster TaxID=48578 RepID=UPI001B8634A3|nr:uncharacterized protein EDB91DRAFT_851104 [Suillus paluster]KAG1728620.1 hypothetical protein EDB91DRAFT_851104 [Suillus paluster]